MNAISALNAGARWPILAHSDSPCELLLRQAGARHFVIPDLFNVGLLPSRIGIGKPGARYESPVDHEPPGSSPMASSAALWKRRLQPRYLSVVSMETCPRRNWICSSLASSLMAEPCAGSSQIVRSKSRNVTTSGSLFHNRPHHFGRKATSPGPPALLIALNCGPVVIPAGTAHSSIAFLTHSGI